MRLSCKPAVFLLLACAAPAVAQSGNLALTHVTVVDAANNRVRPEQTVLISAGRITQVLSGAQTSFPQGTRVIDGTGKFVIPGLLDMHAHIAVNLRPAEINLPLFVANGVTGLRVMNADCKPPTASANTCIEWYRKLQRDIENGAVLGPRLLALGSWAVNGPAGITDSMPPFFKAVTAEDGRELARYLKNRGVDFIKVYNGISRDAFFALAEEARKLNLPFAGHEPNGISALDISNAGQRSIEHSRIFLLNCFRGADSLRQRLLKISATDLRRRMVDEYDPAICADVFRTFAKNRTYITPTHGTRKMDAFADDSAFRHDPRLRYVPMIQQAGWNLDAHRMVTSDSSPAGRKSYMDFYKKGLELTAAAYRAGVPVMVGTDANDSFVYPGFSVLDELDELIKAGLTPAQALDAATRTGAEFLGRASEFGAVVAGHAADLVLLDANPLTDIRNTRRINAVIVNGRYLDRAALDSLLTSAEAAAKRPLGGN